MASESVERNAWDFESGKALPAPPKFASACSDFAADGRTVACTTGDDVELVDATTGARSASLVSPPATDAQRPPKASAIALTRDAHRVVIGRHDGSIEVWDVPSKSMLRRFDAHDGEVPTLTLSPDDRIVLSGGSDAAVKSWELETGKLVRTFKGHTWNVTSAALTRDGRYAITGSWDGTTRLWRLDNGRSVAMVASLYDWLVFDDEGHFDASRNGGALVAAIDGLTSYRIDQLAVRNNRPDLLLERMGLGSPEVIAHYRARHAQRLKKLGLDEAHLAATFDKAPDARIASVAVHGRAADVTIDLADDDSELLRYNVYVNDVPLFGAAGKPVGGRHQRITETIALTSGHNKIEASVLDVTGAESFRPFRIVDVDDKVAGDLYFVGFGVSRYKNPRYDLSYPHKDVLDLAEVLKGTKGTFRDVHVATFVNEQATVANVKAAKQLLQDAKVDDTVVLFVAGHGVHARDAAAEYYFATYETDVRNLPETAARFEIVEDLLQSIAPRKKLFLMDTCESGERDETEEVQAIAVGKSRGLRARTTRALKFVADDSAEAQAARPRAYLFARDRYIYNDLARRSGAIVFSSSRGSELSWENDTIKNGVFTKEIVKAFVTDVADADKDGALSVDELRAYVARSVPEQTRDQQHPTVDRDNLDAKFGFPLVAAAAPVLTRDDPDPAPASRARDLPKDDPRPPPTSPAPPAARMPSGCACHTAHGDTEAPLVAVASLALAALRRARRRRR
jgi:MYXO-CTERM domain-containing protein